MEESGLSHFDKIRAILSEVLAIRPEEIIPTSSMKTIASWDSLRFFRVVVRLEDELGVKFTHAEMNLLKSVPGILDILRKRGITHDGNGR